MCLIRKHQNIRGKNWIPRRNKKIRYYTWRRQHPSISNWQIQKTNYQFPDSTVGKESACNARDPGSIPGWGRPTGEGTGYPLQYSWASFVAQLVKNPPAMWETRVRWLDWEDPLEKGKPTHSSILAWRIQAKSRTWLSDFHFQGYSWTKQHQHSSRSNWPYRILHPTMDYTFLSVSYRTFPKTEPWTDHTKHAIRPQMN